MRRQAPGLVAMVVIGALVASCGRKGDLIPPELAAPEVVGELRARVTSEGIRLRWDRPQTTAGGRTLEGLGAFVVERAVGEGRFERIATVPVTDKERFRRTGHFTHLDPTPASAGATLRYRIIASTVDGYSSPPSTPVEVTTSVDDPPEP